MIYKRGLVTAITVTTGLLLIASAVKAQDSSDEIVITGVVRRPAPQIYQDQINGGFVRLSPDNHIIFSGSDGQPQMTPHQCTALNSRREAAADNMAKDYVAALPSQPDANAREYGQVLVKLHDGTYTVGPLNAGTTWKESLPDNPPQVGLKIPILGVGDYVIGEVHNHPPLNDPNPLANRLPSDADWAFYDKLSVSLNYQNIAPKSAFNVYILGPDGVLREYKQDSPKPTTATKGIGGNC